MKKKDTKSTLIRKVGNRICRCIGTRNFGYWVLLSLLAAFLSYETRDLVAREIDDAVLAKPRGIRNFQRHSLVSLNLFAQAAKRMQVHRHAKPGQVAMVSSLEESYFTL